MDTIKKPQKVLIIGGGSAGAVLANRLSARARREVLLIEAGPAYSAQEFPPRILDSNLLGADTGSDWGFQSVPGRVGHPVSLFRGKSLGGSSAVNGSVMVRALPSDFERWAESGLTGWSWAEVLLFYKKLETSNLGESEWHGATGPMPVNQLSREEISAMQRAFIDSAMAEGIRVTEDFNGGDPQGVAPYPMNIAEGVRVNTAMAYLTDEVRSRGNLSILGDALVDRVLFDGTVATGVRLADGREFFADQVILSAGSYGTAAILMRSGIGPANELSALGLEVLADLPVGRRVYDHPIFYTAFAAVPESLGAQVPVIGAKAWVKSSQAAPGELDLHLTATHLIDPKLSPTGAAFVIAVALVRPKSSGTVTLVSTDPAVAPLIDLNWLAEEEDRRRLLEGIRLAQRIGAGEPLSRMISAEISPGPGHSDAEVIETVFETLDTYHHPTSSAPMGPASDPFAVVDNSGAVHGIQGLRVIDASIFPSVTQAATNPTVIMVAEKIAEQL
ncbi:GMC family oxidoreductase [Psychromicrobium sp. YIM B11713]|uniref:GMC family oxidoreductase n=1 Tax=Psychromicrobium sp. YIM B11713 TaxID=3145233 RepID=UPI00374F3CC5